MVYFEALGEAWGENGTLGMTYSGVLGQTQCVEASIRWGTETSHFGCTVFDNHSCLQGESNEVLRGHTQHTNMKRRGEISGTRYWGSI